MWTLRPHLRTLLVFPTIQRRLYIPSRPFPIPMLLDTPEGATALRFLRLELHTHPPPILRGDLPQRRRFILEINSHLFEVDFIPSLLILATWPLSHNHNHFCMRIRIQNLTIIRRIMPQRRRTIIGPAVPLVHRTSRHNRPQDHTVFLQAQVHIG